MTAWTATGPRKPPSCGVVIAGQMACPEAKDRDICSHDGVTRRSRTTGRTTSSSATAKQPTAPASWPGAMTYRMKQPMMQLTVKALRECS